MDNFRIVSPTQSIYSPNYSFAFKFENENDYTQFEQWTHDIGFLLSVFVIAIYLMFIYFGQMYMSSRASPFRLKKVLIVWNVVLGIFSICGALRMIPEMVHVLANFGFTYSACSNSNLTKVAITSFWIDVFTISKVVELFDTVFVVLRKQKLIFLHWYHHASVTLFTWYAVTESACVARWYATMNFSVHGLMYIYYALRACGVRVPRPIAMFITVSQIGQMVMGTFVTFFVYYQKVTGNQADISYITLYAGIFMYVSYLILFVNYFKSTYMRKVPKVEYKKIQ